MFGLGINELLIILSILFVIILTIVGILLRSRKTTASGSGCGRDWDGN